MVADVDLKSGIYKSPGLCPPQCTQSFVFLGHLKLDCLGGDTEM